MKSQSQAPIVDESQSLSENLNKGCHCITLDREALDQALDREAGDADFYETLAETRPHLFSNAAVFVSNSNAHQMLQIVRAIEAATLIPCYRDAISSWAPGISRHDYGPVGVFMGYDFHLAAQGPKLIEVNSNAGGAFLNALLAKAQRACCAEVANARNKNFADNFESAVLRMFDQEWTRQRTSGKPQRIAIVDDRPAEQYLFPEFVLAQRFFRKHDVQAVIADAGELDYEHGTLRIENQPIDLVYNRLVDFAFDHPDHAALRAAYLDNAVVVTPNPHVHALFADKRNLALLSDATALASWGLPREMLADLAGLPRTVLVTEENARHLWESRKKWFFKPAGGHGGKAVYRGDKVTKGVWAEIIRGGYVAQDFVAPGQRMIKSGAATEARKTDIRLYVYDGQVLLMAARLYQGQTTNFRTPGGGFAPVFVV